MQDFKKVKVWEKSHELALSVYAITADFPREELFGLRTQLRKASVMIPAYIAEGCGRSNNAEFFRLLSLAMSSACQLEYFFLLARDLTMLTEQNYVSLNDELIEVKKMLTSFMQKVN